MIIKDCTGKKLHRIGDFLYIENVSGKVEKIDEATISETDALIDKMFSDPDRQRRVKNITATIR